MTMGEKILSMRKARGWSQEELAEQIGVTRQAVSRWESGAAKPDADKIVGICELFGVSADYLLGLSPERTGADEPPESTKEPQIVYVQQTESKTVFDAKVAGWLLIGVSVLLIVAYFVFREVARTRMEWLFWIGLGGVFSGICIAPGAKSCSKKTYRKRLGWTMVILSAIPLAIWGVGFGLFYGDWEMEILYPTLTAFLPGLILCRDWKKDRFC